MVYYENISKTVFCLLFWMCCAVVGYSQSMATVRTAELQSKILNQLRPVYIYTPINYEERNLVAFDVIYVFDAQHREIFDVIHSSLPFISMKRQYIVVGVTSPSYEDQEYYRNSDFLPQPFQVPIEKYLSNKPNAENFWRFFNDELISYVENNFRTTNRRILIGHSLGASFVLDKAIHHADRFQAFIAVSPNLGYDNYRLSTDFSNFNFAGKGQQKFMYISQGDEPATWGKSWGEGYAKVTGFIDKRQIIGDYHIIVKDFPDQNHWGGYLPAVTAGLRSLSTFLEETPYNLGEEKEITFKVIVPDKNDEAFIVGNQPALGGWDPSKIKLKRTSDHERQITTKVRFPIEFKITRGNWDAEADTDQTDMNMGNITINSVPGNEVKLKVIMWNE